MPEEQEEKQDEEGEESELEEEVEETEGEISSDQFADFMQSSVGELIEGSAPTLEKVQGLSGQEQDVNLEEETAGFQTDEDEQNWDTTPKKDVPEYTMGMEDPYKLSQENVEPPVLRQTHIDTPSQEFIRDEFIDPHSVLSGGAVRRNVYPELLQQEVDEKTKEHYKVKK